MNLPSYDKYLNVKLEDILDLCLRRFIHGSKNSLVLTDLGWVYVIPQRETEDKQQAHYKFKANVDSSYHIQTEQQKLEQLFPTLYLLGVLWGDCTN